MLRCAIPVLILLPLLSSGCKSNEYWSFTVTRKADVIAVDCMPPNPKSLEEVGLGLLLTITSPIWLQVAKIGVDTLLLPITVPHDIYLYHQRRKLRERGIPAAGDAEEGSDSWWEEK